MKVYDVAMFNSIVKTLNYYNNNNIYCKILVDLVFHNDFRVSYDNFICHCTDTYRSRDSNRTDTNPPREFDAESEAMLFSVPDFIGFACHEVGKNELTTSPVAIMIIIASKVRGKVASIPFEQFHKHSAEIITAAVFGSCFLC